MKRLKFVFKHFWYVLSVYVISPVYSLFHLYFFLPKYYRELLLPNKEQLKLRILTRLVCGIYYFPVLFTKLWFDYWTNPEQVLLDNDKVLKVKSWNTVPPSVMIINKKAIERVHFFNEEEE